MNEVLWWDWCCDVFFPWWYPFLIIFTYIKFLEHMSCYFFVSTEPTRPLSPGGAPWGLRCPKGAVLASQKPHMPYCLQIDADKDTPAPHVFFKSSTFVANVGLSPYSFTVSISSSMFRRRSCMHFRIPSVALLVWPSVVGITCRASLWAPANPAAPAASPASGFSVALPLCCLHLANRRGVLLHSFLDCIVSSIYCWYLLLRVKKATDSKHRSHRNQKCEHRWNTTHPSATYLEAATSYCQAGGVVVTVSFNSAHFKLGCCKLERRAPKLQGFLEKVLSYWNIKASQSKLHSQRRGECLFLSREKSGQRCFKRSHQLPPFQGVWAWDWLHSHGNIGSTKTFPATSAPLRWMSRARWSTTRRKLSAGVGQILVHPKIWWGVFWDEPIWLKYSCFKGFDIFVPIKLVVQLRNPQEIPSLGEPNKPSSGFTLVWNRVKKAWELYKGKTLLGTNGII